MMDEIFKQIVESVVCQEQSDQCHSENKDPRMPERVIDSAGLKRFHDRMVRKREQIVTEQREACEKELGWFTAKGAKAHCPELSEIPLNQLTSMLGRMRRLMKQPIRRMPTPDGTMGTLTYNLIVVDAVISEIKLLTAKS
jgi:hypothetical protein